MERETVFNSEIVPHLNRLLDECNRRNFPIALTIEYDRPGQRCMTVSEGPKPSSRQMYQFWDILEDSVRTASKVVSMKRAHFARAAKKK